MPWNKAIVILSCGLVASTGARGDALSVSLGRTRGDTVPDRYEYARTLENRLFPGQRLDGIHIEGSYHFPGTPIGPYFGSWVLGLGHVSADVTTSYPGGTFKLDRQTTFIQGGYQIQHRTLVPDLHLGAQLMLAKGIAGEVTLQSPTGSTSHREGENFFTLSHPYLMGSAGYLVMPKLSLDIMVRFYRTTGPGLFLGATYDISNP